MSNRQTQTFHPTDNNEGGILNIGPAAISINNAGLRAFVAAVDEVEAARREASDRPRGLLVADVSMLADTDWNTVSYVYERDSYNLLYRGVCWEAPTAAVLLAADDARAYLRGCVEQENIAT